MGARPVVWCQGGNYESGGGRSSRNVSEFSPTGLLRFFVEAHIISHRFCGTAAACLTHVQPHAIVPSTEAEPSLSLAGDRLQCWNRLKKSGWMGNLWDGVRLTSMFLPIHYTMVSPHLKVFGATRGNQDPRSSGFGNMSIDCLIRLISAC